MLINALEADAEHPDFVDIGSAARPFFFMKWANVWILVLAVNTPFAYLSALLRGELGASAADAIYVSTLGFGAWIAWKNVTVLNAVVQPGTLRSLFLLFCLSTLTLLGYGVSEIGAGNESEWIRFGIFAVNMGLIGVFALASMLSVAWLRHVRLADLGVKLIDVIKIPSRSAPSPRAVSLPPKNARLGWIYIILGCAVMFGIHLVPDPVLFASSTSAQGIAGLSLIAYFWILFGRSQFQPTAATLLDADRRPPILFLRSFKDEKENLSRGADSSFIDYSLESRIAAHFYKFGPFIAVSAPKNMHIGLGAARAELTDTEWQGRVTEWIDSSSGIVLLAGITSWIDWELRRIIDRGQVEKLILAFPQIGVHWLAKDKRLRSRRRSATFRMEAIRSAFAGTQWEEGLSHSVDPLHIRSIVFGVGGQVTLITAKSRDRNTYHLSVLIAHFILLRNPAEALPLAQPEPRRECP